MSERIRYRSVFRSRSTSSHLGVEDNLQEGIVRLTERGFIRIDVRGGGAFRIRSEPPIHERDVCRKVDGVLVSGPNSGNRPAFPMFGCDFVDSACERQLPRKSWSKTDSISADVGIYVHFVRVPYGAQRRIFLIGAVDVSLCSERPSISQAGSLHRHTLRQIPGLVHIAPAQNRGVVRQQLQRNRRNDRLQKLGHDRHTDDFIGQFNRL